MRNGFDAPLKITVITAVFNRYETIRDTLESVLSQSYPFVEFIVIDGGSSDGTIEILRLYRENISILICERDEGIYYALNKGIQHSTGDVLGFLHADDIFQDSSVLDKIARSFRDVRIDAVYGDLVYVSQDDPTKVVRYWKSGVFSYTSFRDGWMPPHPTFYVRRSVYEEFGRFNTDFHIAADFDLLLRFLGIGMISAAYIPEVLVRMRLGGVSNRSLKTIFLKTWEDFIILRRHKVGGVLTLLNKNIRKLEQFRVR